ncbi:MAG: UDP-2,3-diacylglucosamine diphosphatase [Campylobacterota bacterium]|nr:UDP-2,3-diacylglucosamine diphosphatase [Campylobacterota bacterium]
MITLKDNALFIADSHYNRDRTELYRLLLEIQKGDIELSQLFLMGDIFDFLAGEINYFIKINSKIIDMINNISTKCEVIYLEGNHDYNLKDVFAKLKVVSRESQPINIDVDGRKTALSHGDIFTPTAYNIYCKIIRNSFLLKFLNIIDINNWLTKKVEKALSGKHICKKMDNFDTFVKKRYKAYDTDMVIEGHFHQTYLSEDYINIPSLYCDKSYLLYKDKRFEFVNLKETN